MSFAIDLPIYAGPLDLLLYLVRREELEISDISMSRIVNQFCDSLEMLREIDLDDVGEFVEVASQLIELKAKHILPAEPDMAQDVEELLPDEPASELVHRLVLYQRYRDVASMLDERSRMWQLRYARLTSDLPARRHDPTEQPIAELEVWDLVSAFGRILRARQPEPADNVIYDDTPIHIYMQRIHERILDEGRVELQSLFEPGYHKSTLVALFLASLELSRHYGVRTFQSDERGSLWLTAGDGFSQNLVIAQVSDVEADSLARSNLEFRPR
jgi:segregation and condensation protein A